MKKIAFVSHCLLNTASKVVMFNEAEMAAEEELRRRFLEAAIKSGVQLVQLPCPEFTLYGSRRWGHVSEQFDNPFFRGHCRRLLMPVVCELREYLSNGEEFELLAIIGIDGSPSCGVDYTCTGEWGGNLGERGDLLSVVSTARLSPGKGIFFDELVRMLSENGITAPIKGLFAAEPEKIMSLFET